MRVLVTGAGGLLAAALVPALHARGDEVLALPRAELDVTRADEVAKRVLGFRPDWIAHLAADTRVDDCEAEPERAMLVNGLGSRNVAAAAAACGAALLAISTDYVFDGRATRPIGVYDPVAPLNAYGRSKWAGECAVRELCPRHVIARTAWLFGPGGRNFVDGVLARARGGEPLAVVDDQRSSPTFTRDLAAQLLRLVDGGHLGTFHCTNAGECTWHELATHALAAARITAEVKRISTRELGRPAPRPAYSVLDNAWTERVTGHRMPDWKDAVRGPLETQARAILRDAAVTFARLGRRAGHAVAEAAEIVIASLENGGTVYFCGNGGSAADAQHLACELAGRYLFDRPSLAAVALTTNTSALTAIGNDFGYADVFSRQLEGLGTPGDVLVAITTSGGSRNVLRAVATARRRGMSVIGMTGPAGAKLAAACDVALVTPAAGTPRIQEGHIAMGHALCELVERALFPAERAAAAAPRARAPRRPRRRRGAR